MTSSGQSTDFKYAELSKTYYFFPPAFETMDSINQTGLDFVIRVGFLHLVCYRRPAGNFSFFFSAYNYKSLRSAATLFVSPAR
jgi:hypothetical protein